MLLAPLKNIWLKVANQISDQIEFIQLINIFSGFNCEAIGDIVGCGA